MKPGFEVRVADELLQEQEVKSLYSKIPALAKHYNQKALIHDSDFDKISIALALSSGFVMTGSAFYFNQIIPLYLFAFILLGIFIAALSLRLQRENFYKSVNDPKNELKDKVQMAAEHNVSYIKNKTVWLMMITFIALTLIALCAAEVSGLENKWIFFMAAPVTAAVISAILYFNSWKNLKIIHQSFTSDIKKEILNIH